LVQEHAVPSVVPKLATEVYVPVAEGDAWWPDGIASCCGYVEADDPQALLGGHGQDRSSTSRTSSAPLADFGRKLNAFHRERSKSQFVHRPSTPAYFPFTVRNIPALAPR
jgi:hypothetical protein